MADEYDLLLASQIEDEDLITWNCLHSSLETEGERSARKDLLNIIN